MKAIALTAKVNPPQLVFQDHPLRSGGRFGWTGSWPPPTYMLVVVSRVTGQASFVDYDPPSLENVRTLRELRRTSRPREFLYKRASFSALPESVDQDETSKVFRAASYTMESWR